MTKSPDKKPPGTFDLPPISVEASAQAPFIFFEDASVYGAHDGVLRITLEATRLYPKGNQQGVAFERVAVAHLRMSPQAAASLKSAIDGVFFLANQAASESRN